MRVRGNEIKKVEEGNEVEEKAANTV